HTADINLVAVSPDGQTIATCSDDRTIKLWNIISGAELATFKGHTAAVWAVAFSPDGRKLVSTSEDKTVKVWRVPL
ncbi:MAG: WD40 repeat domain-containing protein, partial [Xenococcaceae cyanobacterium]